ncbi:uncharacterized protein LOC131151603 [Malania oleifera]|uniref:uncharacterized protein LOC131151603 n=1 Tax=Malania oleifera TaxID=397392 RepID=UPI0025ADD1EE|nr:uncharacterized protein LOC131151603 [Malania oleifera]
MEGLTEDERRALRGSKFAPLPAPPPSSRFQPKQAHPGGPVTTNKAAALAKFLERKLQDPSGLASLNPDLIELAVKNAKQSVKSCGASNSGRTVRHVTSFSDTEDLSQGTMENHEPERQNKKKKKKKDKKNKKQKMVGDPGLVTVKKPKKKLKL